ncbi:MAG: tRNA (N6-isopentenyl adenosine(37)-C2)-methylthiotransferase MiaB [Bdellovibrionales bacterium]|nr:tRNA (N6-isopentenyl adenosine(37)-C2)-methylthiotransferase MiaB [Bdellovibrionales bacterium]
MGKIHGVFISTYGCQMNVNDSERMLALLEMANYVSVSSPEEADLIIINSCSVREKPVHKVHSEVGRYRVLKSKNPRLRIGVAGCVAQQEKGQLLKDIPLLDFILGTDAIDELPDIVGRLYENSDFSRANAKVVSARFEHQKPYHIQTLVRNPGVTAFVNITKGCDNFCTFCVVPFTRGRERSRPMAHLLADVHQMTARGIKEVTLLGQNVNSYKSDCGAHFAHLLQTLATQTNIERIRFTTSHPKDFNEELVDVIQNHRQKVVEYIHLPVQSGNSQVLQRMNRGYSRKEYIDKAHLILNKIPGVALSTDIIVGFPGETEEQFMETMSLLDEVPYENIYAFAYSPRPLTKAAKYTDAVDPQVQSDRLTRLLAKHREIAFKLAKQYEGQIVPVLVEEFHSDLSRVAGRSPQNKMVHFGGTQELIGKTVLVRIKEAFPLTLRGEQVHLGETLQ